MEGVTILSQTPDVVSHALLGVIFVALSVLGIIMAYWGVTDTSVGMVVFGVVCVLFFGLLTAYQIHKVTNPETIYKIIVDDTVAFNEFTEYYEILSNDNLIYTVKERK